MRERPSPNFDARRPGLPVGLLVLHYTGMRDAESALARLCDPSAKVSAHYLVDEDGTVTLLVDEAARAWHAGVSFWAGERDVNSRSIGVELVNPGHEWGYRPFTEAQYAALIDLARGILGRHPIAPAGVLGHSDVAPQRRQDPGELFDWERLAAAGIGRVCAVPAGEGAALRPGDAGPEVAVLQGGLARIGYDCAPTGRFDAATEAVVAAFQRHFRRARVDGLGDGETRARIAALSGA